MQLNTDLLKRVEAQMGADFVATLTQDTPWERNDNRVPSVSEKGLVAYEAPLAGSALELAVLFRWSPPDRPEVFQYGARTVDRFSGAAQQLYIPAGTELAECFDRVHADATSRAQTNEAASQLPTFPAALSEIPSKCDLIGQIVRRREDIATLVDLPLLAAAEHLYDLNIRTVDSSANSSDIIRGEVGLSIDYDHLSDHNKAVADRVCSSRNGWKGTNLAGLTMKVSGDIPVHAIVSHFDELVRQFAPQPMTWVKCWTPETLYRCFAGVEMSPGEREKQIEWLVSEQGYFYHSGIGVMFSSEEHLVKALQSGITELEPSETA